MLTKEPGAILSEGFYHSLGHGVGLEVHEPPLLGRNGEEFVPGDVLAIEPGTYRPGFGGCVLEDLVLVTADGSDVLTDYPYELAPEAGEALADEWLPRVCPGPGCALGHVPVARILR